MKVTFWKLARPALGAVGCLMAGAIAHAAIYGLTPDSIFVGKGDYQIACGYNNQQAQTKLAASTNASWNVQWSETTEYDAVCEWDTTTGRESKIIHHTVSKGSTVGVSAVATGDYKPRNNSKGTNGSTSGIFLTLAATTVVTTGEVPVEGGSCGPDNASSDQPPGTYTSVTEVSSTSTDKTVYVDCTGGANPTTAVGPVVNLY